MYDRFVKRILDLILSIIGIVILLPVWIIVPVLIKMDDGGSVFYLSPRIGKNSKKILMYKFRSMKVGSEDIRNADGSTYNFADDPRVTKIGKVLRRTSIDELPQLFNVLKGEMSLIGPRASTWDMLDTYKPDEIDKMKVRPGITGYCQAYYRNALPARDKRVMDAWYANRVSFGLDMKIIFKTISTVFKKDNLYTNR
ncbi:MAG: sugar transferase [Bacteroidales bacterium]|nr:sugar transferase [Bacteroidales bacterium]